MSDNIFWMFISALLTFILELFFFKKEFKNIVNNKYLTKIVFLINFITNLLFNTLRSILIPDTEIGYILFFVIPEIIVIVVEYFMYKYFYGLYKEKNSYIYVSAGTRWWGPPMRLFSKSEIVKIILEKANTVK